MSFSAYKRNALDETRQLNQRMSNLRSCALKVAEKYRVRRSEVIELVRQLSGSDITTLLSEPEIRRAAEVLKQIKDSGLNPPSAPPTE